jgi:acyl-CoA dehydrogenase
VHQVTLARQVLRNFAPSNELFPSYSLPNLKAAALEKYGEALEGLAALEAAE